MMSVYSLTNNASQILQPGGVLIFNVVVLKAGHSECFRPNTGAVILRNPGSIHEVHFSANIGATVAGEAQLALALNGTPMEETTMISTNTADNALNRVGICIPVRTCCCGETISVINTGTTAVMVTNPSLFVKRDA